jgi:proline iminopeptidase
VARLDVNGLQIEYDTFGSPDDDPLLLIMGLGTQMVAWPVDFCEALAAHGHHVIRFDNRDIGLSTKFDGAGSPGRLRYLMNYFVGTPLGAPYTLTDMAADAVGVLDALDIESAHVVGASMGGMIAQLVTVHYPERVKSLTSIMSTSGARGLPRPRPDIMRHIFRDRPSKGDATAMFEHLVKSLQLIGSPGYPRSDEEIRTLIKTTIERSHYPQGFVRQLAALVDDGSRVERLKTIDKRTLVIHGRDDPFVRVECGIDTARHIKGAKLEIIDGMGHDLPPQLIGRLASLIVDHAREATLCDR